MTMPLDDIRESMRADAVRQNAEVAAKQKRLLWLVITSDYIVSLVGVGEPARIATAEVERGTGLIRIPILLSGIAEEITEVEGATRSVQIPVGIRPFNRPKVNGIINPT